MDQELLLEICRTIIKSEKENIPEVLRKNIEDNKLIIKDKKTFYSEILSALSSSNLSVTTKPSHGKIRDIDEKKTVMNQEKLEYIEEIIYNNLDIGNGIEKPLLLLSQYNDAKVINLIDRLANTSELREHVIEALTNMKFYYQNEELVEFVLKNDFINSNTVGSLTYLIQQKNVAIHNKYRELELLNPLELSQETYEVIKIVNEHKKAAEIITRVFDSFGKNIRPNNKFFYDIFSQYENVNYNFSELFNRIDNYDTTNLNFIELAELLSEKNLYGLVHTLILDGKIKREELGNMKKINEVVENTLFEQIEDPRGIILGEDENQFLEDILESHAIYNLDAENLVKIVEYLYKDIKHNPSDRVKEVRKKNNKDYNPENDAKLEFEMLNVIEPIADSGHRDEYFLEKVLIKLLESENGEHYESSILTILDGRNKIEMEFDDHSIYPNTLVAYDICAYGTEKIIKEALKNHEMPMYMSNHTSSIDLVKVYARLGEYDEAIKKLYNPLYEIVDPREEHLLKQEGQVELDDPELYRDNVSDLVQALRYKKDSKSIKFMEEVIHHPYLTIMNTEVLEKISLLFNEIVDIDPEVEPTCNTLTSYLKELVQKEEIQLYTVNNEREDGWSGKLKIAPPSEVEKAISNIDREKPSVKKLVIHKTNFNENKKN